MKYFGEAYLPKTAKEYKTKSKNAQEAHEAIRPAHVDETPKKLETKLDSDAHKLYELILETHRRLPDEPGNYGQGNR